MRVFLTGSTGFVGEAVLGELIGAGHEVVGLCRSEPAAAKLRLAGGEPYLADLTDPDALEAGARSCDGVVHLAFIHDFQKYLEAGATDLRAIEAYTRALEDSGKPMIVTTGSAVLTPGRIGIETDDALQGAHANPRAASEAAVMAAADRGIRASVVRLAPSVHGAGDHGFIPGMIAIAREKGFSAYVGDGSNRWPAVARSDAAKLFRLALESAPAGTYWHGVAEEGLRMRDIATFIGEQLGVPTRSIDAAEAGAHFGWLAHFVSIDNPVSSVLTQQRLGWAPTGPDLFTDMAEQGYFNA